MDDGREWMWLVGCVCAALTGVVTLPGMLGGTRPGVLPGIAPGAGHGTPAADASGPDGRPLLNLPPPTAFFTGREAESARITEALSPWSRHRRAAAHRLTGRPTPAVCVIRGMGGVGKSQLAAKFARGNLHDYTLVRRLAASGPECLQADLLELARWVGVPEHENKQLMLGRLWAWLRDNPGWLLIYDDVRPIGDGGAVDWIDNFWPEEGDGAILVTTQVRDGWSHRSEHVIQLLPLSPAEGRAFLVRRTECLADVTDDGTGLTALGALLGWLPLALEQAGAYICDSGISIDEYLGHLPERIGIHGATGQTFALALERVRALEPGAEDLLRLFAFLGPEPVPRDMLFRHKALLPRSLREAAINSPEFDRRVLALVRHSLLTRAGDNRGEPVSYGIHPVVQMLVRESLDAAARLQWSRAAVRLVEAEFPDDPELFSSWTACERLSPHVEAATQLLPYGDDRETIIRLLHRVGRYHAARRDPRAKGFFERELALRTGYGDPLARARAHRCLADTLFVLAQLPQAEAECRRALEVCAAEPPGDRNVRLQAGCHLLLGGILREQVRFDEALEAVGRATAIYRAHGEEWLGIDWARAEQETGQIYRNAGRLRDADACYRRADALVPGRPSQEPAEHQVFRAMLKRDLGITAIDRGDLAGAEELLRGSLEVLRNHRGRDDFETAQIEKFLADVVRRQAANLIQRARKSRRPRRRWALRHEANLKIFEAQQLLEPVLALHQRRREAEGHKYAACLNKQGSLLLAMGEPVAGLAKLREAEAIYRRVYGEDHPYLAKTLSRKGPLLLALGAYQEAEAELRRAEAIFKRRLGRVHPALIAVYERLAVTVRDPQEAERFRRRALDIRRVHAADGPNRLPPSPRPGAASRPLVA
jgi:tetratricopeptide (TPR) repeat protein